MTLCVQCCYREDWKHWAKRILLSVLGEMMYLQDGLVGGFLLRLVRAMMVTVTQKLLWKRKGLGRCRASCINYVYNCCQSVRWSQYLLAEEAEKSTWKGLCWLQVFVAFGCASCKNRQIWLQWKGVMGQLQRNCYPGGILEALAGSHEMHLPGEDCIANRPCPSLSVNSFGSRLAPEHLKIFIIKLQSFFPSLRWGWGLHYVHWFISHVWLFQKVSL